MFINGSAIGVALHLFAIMIVVLAGVLVAHVIWIFRLARTPALMDRPLPVRLLLVASALATPVLSFYAVEIAALWRRRASVAWRGCLLAARHPGGLGDRACRCRRDRRGATLRSRIPFWLACG